MPCWARRVALLGMSSAPLRVAHEYEELPEELRRVITYSRWRGSTSRERRRWRRDYERNGEAATFISKLPLAAEGHQGHAATPKRDGKRPVASHSAETLRSCDSTGPRHESQTGAASTTCSINELSKDEEHLLLMEARAVARIKRPRHMGQAPKDVSRFSSTSAVRPGPSPVTLS